MQGLKSWFELVSMEAITAVEARLGVTLPADYKAFLLKTNGLRPEPDLCFAVPERGEVMLGCLYGLKPERTSCDLEHEQGVITHWTPLPAGYVTIGEDPGGNAILLATSGENAGRVLFWDRVGFWVGEDGGNTFRVANSFAAFVESLRELPDEAQPRSS
jgi:hypothetical protein